MSMHENIIMHKSEYKTDENVRRIRFAVDNEGEYRRDKKGGVVPGEKLRSGDHKKLPDAVWDEIVNSNKIHGLTSAPKL